MAEYFDIAIRILMGLGFGFFFVRARHWKKKHQALQSLVASQALQNFGKSFGESLGKTFGNVLYSGAPKGDEWHDEIERKDK